jgi:hypothetical protein
MVPSSFLNAMEFVNEQQSTISFDAAHCDLACVPSQKGLATRLGMVWGLAMCHSHQKTLLNSQLESQADRLTDPADSTIKASVSYSRVDSRQTDSTIKGWIKSG